MPQKGIAESAQCDVVCVLDESRFNVNNAKWVVLNETWYRRSSNRADYWNGKAHMVGGERPGDGTAARTFRWDFETRTRSYAPSISNSLKSVSQCPYNNDTFISWGGDDNTYHYDDFQFLGGMLRMCCLLTSVVLYCTLRCVFCMC